LKNLASITVRLTEKDPSKLHSPENIEKLEMCAQAIEIGAAISFAISGLIGIEHMTFADEKRMQVSFVFSVRDEKVMHEFLKNFGTEGDGLFSSLQRSNLDLAKDGIEVQTKITPIETMEFSV
jgi:hypothetical protein